MRLLLVGTNLNAMQKSSDLESRVYESCDVKCKLPKYHLLSFQELSSYLEDNTTRFVIVDKSTDGDFLRIDYQHQSFNKVVSSLIRMRGYKFGSYRSGSKFGAHDLVVKIHLFVSITNINLFVSILFEYYRRTWSPDYNSLFWNAWSCSRLIRSGLRTYGEKIFRSKLEPM